MIVGNDGNEQDNSCIRADGGPEEKDSNDDDVVIVILCSKRHLVYWGWTISKNVVLISFPGLKNSIQE